MLSGKEQGLAVSTVWKAGLKVGDTWYVLDARWFRSWKAFAGFNADRGSASEECKEDRPGPIDNSELAEGNARVIAIKKGLFEDIDFNIVCEEVWKLLFGWFGGGPIFERVVKAVGYGNSETTRLDMYPYHVTIFAVDPLSGAIIRDSGKLKRFESGSCLAGIVRELYPQEKKIDSSLDGTSSVSSDDEDDDAYFRVWQRNQDAKMEEDQVAPPAYENVISDFAGLNLNISQDGKGVGAPGADTFITNAAKERAKEPKDGWVLIPKQQWRTSLEHVTGYKQGHDIAIERKKSDGSWSRYVYVKNWRDFEVGDQIDAKDSVNKWYVSEVKQVREGEIFVNYVGWPERWDAWIKVNSDALAPKNTHTTKPYSPAISAGAISATSYSTGYSTGYSSGSYYYGGGGSSYSFGNEKGTPSVNGVVGLRNLGNTCFMNSTIQCLSNSPQLTEYFVRGNYLKEINNDNPLGWKGQVAKAYGELVKEIWSNENTLVAPRNFKQVLGEFAPRFSGFQQHDSQEFLSFLLDGIHEDLNRVLKKPATNAVEGCGRPDAAVAKEAWEVHQQRNQSVVVDLVQGQFKSELTCPTCDIHSVTFDPFMFVTLPVPSAETKQQSVTVIFANGSRPPTVYQVQVSKVGRITDLKKALEPLCGIPARSQVIADVWAHKVYRFFEEDASVTEMRGTDKIYVYEIPELLSGKAADFVMVQVLHKTTTLNPAYDSTWSYSQQYKTEVVGVPCVLVLQRNSSISTDDMMKLLLHKTCQRTGDATVEGEHDASNPPFIVRVMEPDGRNCLRCNYSDKCNGCELTSAGNGCVEVSNDRTAKFALQLDWRKDIPAQFTETSVNHSTAEVGAQGSSSGEESVPLGKCFEAFAKQEVLGEEEMWYCGGCKEFRQASKKMDIWTPPPILIIHLKRFSYTRYSRDKINTLVTFPLEGMTLGESCLNPAFRDEMYDLYAVSNHMGGLGNGHYTAYGKNLVDDQWYLYDDSRTCAARKDEIVSSSAYVLFYHRRDPRKCAPGQAFLANMKANGSSADLLNGSSADLLTTSPATVESDSD